ncbi:hypothetical protein WR25_08181 [Diploscapter pachys]|uniref:Uncharacterized protein n=1 Tax=Diploscapter pachys TaxID=2018661 RepID=A0A2A2JWQ0_9BILA|nr:hypothetical protein WR25_08181 [Diploscapter pachys]
MHPRRRRYQLREGGHEARHLIERVRRTGQKEEGHRRRAENVDRPLRPVEGAARQQTQRSDRGREDRHHHQHAGHVPVDRHPLDPEDQAEEEIAAEHADRGEGGERAAEFRAPHPPAPRLPPPAHEGRGAEQQSLLDDDDGDRGKDIALIAAGPVEQRLLDDRDRRATAIELASRQKTRLRDVLDDRGHRLADRAGAEQIGGVDPDRDPRSGRPGPQLALQTIGDQDDAVGLAAAHVGARGREVVGHRHDVDGAGGIQVADHGAAEGTGILIDDHHGQLARCLVRIGRGIVKGIEDDREQHRAEQCARGEDRTPRRDKSRIEAHARPARARMTASAPPPAITT